MNSEVVARVNKKTLTKKELSELVGSGPVGTKTLFHATSRWVENTLLQKNADSQNNIFNFIIHFLLEFVINAKKRLKKQRKLANLSCLLKRGTIKRGGQNR